MEIRRTSPWAGLEEEFRASGLAYRELCRQLNSDFRGVQEEAYATLCSWERETDLAESGLTDVDIASGEGPIDILSSVQTALNEFVNRFHVVPWTESELQYAAPKSRSTKTITLTVHVDELAALNLQPRLSIKLNKKKAEWFMSIGLLPQFNPERPGETIKPKAGNVSVRLIRPAPKEEVLMSFENSKTSHFWSSKEKVHTLPNYEPGEEHQWEAEVSMRIGSG